MIRTGLLPSAYLSTPKQGADVNQMYKRVLGVARTQPHCKATRVISSAAAASESAKNQAAYCPEPTAPEQRAEYG